MVEINARCNECDHTKVCGKKETYSMFCKETNEVAISLQNNESWLAKDCDDVVLKIECKHYKPDVLHVKR